MDLRLARSMVAIVAATSIFYQLGGSPLWDRDEPRNARCSVEMWRRSDWVVPTFNGELRAHKPVLTYWLMMSAYSVFGVSEFSARFWSALLGVGTVLLTHEMARKLFGWRAAIFAAGLLCGAPMFQVASRAATPDSPLIFFSTLGIASYAILVLSAPGAQLQWSLRTSLIVYGSLAFAVLAKGPVGLVLPLTVIGACEWIRSIRDSKRDKASMPRTYFEWGSDAIRFGFGAIRNMRPWLGAVVVATIVLPWFVAVSVATGGEFLSEFFVNHHLRRATEAMEGHTGGVAFYPLAILIGFFPGSAFAAPIIGELAAFARNEFRSNTDSFKGDATRPVLSFSTETMGLTLLVAWVAIYVGVFTLAQTKLPSYVTPCYPALALGAGWFLDRCVKENARSWKWLQTLAFGALGLGGVAILVAVQVEGGKRVPEAWQIALAGIVPLSVAAIYFVRRHSTARPWVIASVSALAPLLGSWMIGHGSHLAGQSRTEQALWRSVKEWDSTGQIGAYNCLEPSTVFYSDRVISELPPTSLKQQLDAIPLDANQLDAVLLLRSDFEQLDDRTKKEWRVVCESPRFLKKDSVVFLAREAFELARSKKHPQIK